MSKEFVLCLFGLLVLTSCLSVNGLDTGYGTLTEVQKGRVLKYMFIEKDRLRKMTVFYMSLDGIFDTSLFESPLLFMDNEAYGTHVQSKYESRFLEDLTGKTYKERGYGRFLLFRHGLYVGTYDSYTDVFNPNI